MSYAESREIPFTNQEQEQKLLLQERKVNGECSPPCQTKGAQVFMVLIQNMSPKEDYRHLTYKVNVANNKTYV